MKTIDVIKKINDIEEALQRLKLKLFFNGKTNLSNGKSIYDEEDFIDQIRDIRREIWNKTYASKI